MAEVAAALDDLVHESHRHELVFRTSGVVPSAAGLGGPLLGGVLAPARSPSAPSAAPAASAASPAEPPPAIEEYDDFDPLVIRTDFTDQDAWDRVVEELRVPWADNQVDPHLISDPRYAGVPTERVLQDVLAALAGRDLPGWSSSPTAPPCTGRNIRCWPCRPIGTVNPSRRTRRNSRRSSACCPTRPWR
ncbi:hypothetical protein NKH18_22105 [Streptomyces sp. M10(2022)]